MAYSVDLSQVYQAVDSGAALLAAGVITWVGKRAVTFISAHLGFLGEKTDALLASGLNTALQNGASIALHSLDEWEAAHKSVPVNSWLAEKAGQYAATHAGDAVEHFGLGPAQLAEKALAYLPPATTKEEAVTAALNVAQLLKK